MKTDRIHWQPLLFGCPLLAGLCLVLFLISGAAGAEDWPQFRGPNRDGMSTEKDLLQEWPEGGPEIVWTVSGIGSGYSSPAIAQGSLYITGDAGDDLCISAFDLAGKPKWRAKNGQSWKQSYKGARATCTLDRGRLYHMNAHGRAACLDAADGREIWAVNILERFGAKNIPWGISDCLLVDGDRVIVMPGGEEALVAALDRNTGATLWTSGPLEFLRTRHFGAKDPESDPPVRDIERTGYASPSLFESGGRRLIAGCSANHFFIVDAEVGKILWTKKVPARYEMIGAIPLVRGDSIFFTAPDEFGGLLLRVEASPSAVSCTELWTTPLDNCHGALVWVGDRLYGAGYRKSPTWACLDAATGQMLYTMDDPKKGSIVWADERLYALGEDGVMTLLEPTAQGFRTAGRFRLVENIHCSDAWAHPVICGGRMFLRYDENLYCYDISRK